MSENSNVNHVISPTPLKSPTIATSIALSSTSPVSASITTATINPTLASSASTITRASGTTATTMLNGHVGTQFNSKSNFEDYSSSNEANYIPIPQFYAGRSVFITGGTGFMGKVSSSNLLNILNIIQQFKVKKKSICGSTSSTDSFQYYISAYHE